MANIGNAVGRVTFIKGRVLAHAQDGSTRVLKEGDLVHEGEVLLAGPEGYIELQFNNGRTYSAGAKQILTLDETVIGSDLPESRDAALLAEADETAAIARAIAKGSSLDALLEETAAGLGGGAGSVQEGHGFVQLLRIVEAVSPIGYEYGTERTRVMAAPTGFPLNAPPVAVPDEATTDEDTPVRIAVRVNDGDPENDPLTVISVTQGSHGTVVIDPATGNPVYTPATNWNGVDTFTYTISDGHGGTASTTVTVLVNPVNDAPVAGTVAVTPDGTATPDPNSVGAGNYEHTIPEDSSVSGLVRATDVDGDKLTFSQASKPAHGVAVVNPDGSYTYTPNPDYNGTDSFTVLVSDGNGGTALSTVNIVVTPVQDPSVITPGFGSVTEDVALTTSGRLSISDVDGPQDERFVPQTNVAGAHGSFSIGADGNWTYNLNNADPAVQALGAGQTMTEVFKVTGVDGTPSTVTVTINGLDENSVPLAVGDVASTPQNVPVTINVLQNDRDPDGDPLSINGFGQGGHGTVELVGGKLVYTPSAGFTGTDTFQYSVSDGKGGTDTAMVTVTVGGNPAVNPVAVSDSSLGNTVGVPVRVDVLANDSDADGTLIPATVRIIGTANAGDPLAVPGEGNWTVDPSTGAITFTPEAGFSSNPTPIQYVVQDNDGNSSVPATVVVGYTTPAVVMVTGVSSPSVHEGGNLDFVVTLSNPSSSPTTVALTPKSGTATLGTDTTTPIEVSFDGGKTWSTVTGPGPSLSISVPAGVTGFTVRIPTTADNISEPNETLTLDAATAQNATPVTGMGTITDGTPTLNIPDTDGAGNATDSTLPETAGPTVGSFTVGAPAGLASITVGTTPITLAQLNALGSTPVTIDTGEGTLVLTGYDPASGVVSYTYDPKVLTHTGSAPITDSIGIVVTDANGVSTNGSLDIAITDSKPVAVDDGNSITEDATPNTVSGNVLTDSKTGDTVGADVNATPITPVTVALTYGSLVLKSDGSYTYTLNNADPAVNKLNNGQTLTDSYTYILTDGDGSSTTAKLTITINGTNDRPVAKADVETTLEDTPVSGNVLANDIDVDGPAALTVTGFTVEGVSGTFSAGQTAIIPGVGTLVINSNGSYTFTPAANYNGPVPICAYSVTDGVSSASSTLSITMTPVNDAPVLATPPAVNVSEEGLRGGIADTTGTPDTTNATVVSGSLAITDPDNSTFSISLTAPVASLTSNGAAVAWLGGSPGVDLVGSAGGTEVIRVHVSNTGAYTVTLSAPVDHATAGVEDAKTLSFGVSVSDGIAPAATTTLTVNIEDDAPYLGNQHQAVTLPPQDTNLMIVLDVSGSMETNVTIGGVTMTRLAAAVQAINTLLDSYDALGNVAVRIVTFSTNANAHGTTWETVASARTYLATLTPNGGTNYDEALGDAMAAFSSAGSIAGAQNVSYFMTDGLPTFGSGTTSTLVGTNPNSTSPTPNGTGNSQAGTDTGIQSAEEATWTTFVNNNDIKSYAIAMGGPYNSTNSFDGQTHTSQYYIDPVAYDGTGTGTNTNGVIVTDWNTLSATLTATVSASVAGQILTGNALGTNWGIGADGGYLQSVGIDGNTFTFNRATGEISTTAGSGSYSYDVTTHVLTVNTAHGGILAIDMHNGEYTYRVNGAMTQPYAEVLNATLRDNDGDTATGTLTLDVARAMGGAGNDVITGTTGNDTIIGGPGSDTMSGLAGADTFRWVLGDATGSPTDTITDFNMAAPTAGGDVLDLRDLLVGESHVGSDAGNLANYLHFTYSGGTNSTTISVMTHDTASNTQTIVLQGVNLTTLGASDTAIIQALLTNNKLIVD